MLSKNKLFGLDDDNLPLRNVPADYFLKSSLSKITRWRKYEATYAFTIEFIGGYMFFHLLSN